jgi:SAM-dependent methyltransferase
VSDPGAPAGRDHAFDAYATGYDAALEQGLSVTGESKLYFARGRASWTAHRLSRLGIATPAAVLDFGCGTGSATPFLRAAFAGASVLGVDVSAASLERARAEHGGDGVTFATPGDVAGVPRFDLAFCNGVFHHIAPARRAEQARWIWSRLRPGGTFALWENNPWNPGTRWVMSRIPFDRDAELLTPPATRRLLRSAGFEIAGTDYLFIFPHALRVLRPIERWLARLPLGGQYLVLARKA